MKAKLFFIVLSALSLTSCNPVFRSRKTESFTTASHQVPETAGNSTSGKSSDTTVSQNTNTKNTTLKPSTSNPSTSYDKNLDFQTDPYSYTDSESGRTQFYANYQPATCYKDSYYRSLHYLMSGDLTDQLQRPTIASNQPMDGTKYVKNNHHTLSADGTSYSICDSNGNIIKTIYRGGAYQTLEEVAAYVTAFDDIPANYTSDKSTTSDANLPLHNNWGKWLRLNHSYFSDANKPTGSYPYEPDLPNAYKGKGYQNGTYRYYEMDIGTTGSYEYSTSYTPHVYNDGKNQIVRGASRIVYSYENTSYVSLKPEEKHVFYTFNHYNDFQEYLNYENGWGKWFGNIAGGGSMNNKTSSYRTDYPEVTLRNLY